MKFKIRMDSFTQICSYEDIERIQEFTGNIIHNLEDLLESAERMVVEAKKLGASVIKNYHAYFRDLHFEIRTYHEAEQCLNKILHEDRFAAWDRYIRYSPDEMRCLGDYMVHYFCLLAIKHDMVLAFHTGPSYHFTAGPRNLAELNNLFALYPDVHFNLMHGNLPHYQEAAYLAGRMHNISIDLCWCHLLSTTYSLEALYFWLGLAPISRIIGYGTDNNRIESMWWCSKLARKTTYQALARHIDEGRFTENDAAKIAAMILYENPERIFKFNRIV